MDLLFHESIEDHTAFPDSPGTIASGNDVLMSTLPPNQPIARKPRIVVVWPVKTCLTLAILIFPPVIAGIWVYVASEHEHRIATRIEELGGKVQFRDVAPNWIPSWYRNRNRNFDRIYSVDLKNTEVSKDILNDLASLPFLTQLSLRGCTLILSDMMPFFGMKHLKSLAISGVYVRTDNRNSDEPINARSRFGQQHLKSGSRDSIFKLFESFQELESLDLTDAAIRDVDLKFLVGLKRLRFLRLTGTLTTNQGRAEFQKAAPDCEILADR